MIQLKGIYMSFEFYSTNFILIIGGCLLTAAIIFYCTTCYQHIFKTHSNHFSVAGAIGLDQVINQFYQLSKIDSREIGRAVQQECRDRSRMPSSA